MKKLNFGCGSDIRQGKDWDNVDIQKGKGIKSFNFDKFPYPIKENSYDYVFLSNVLEHLEEPDQVINELWRISKDKAIIDIIIPHYTNKGAYSELQHKHYFNEVAFKLLEEQRTKVKKEQKFKIREIKITPTNIGKIFPRAIREKLALFVNGLLSQIHVKLEVIK